MTDTINCIGLNKVVDIPLHDDSETRLAQLNWLREVDKPYFLAGLTFCDNYPHEEGSTIWVVEMNNETGLKPIFCTLYHAVEEESWLDTLSERTQMDREVIRLLRQLT